MTTLQKVKDRVESLIELATRTVATTQHPQGLGISKVNKELFIELRTSTLSFIQNIYGAEHSFYKDLDSYLIRAEPSQAEQIRGILKAIKSEVESGWLITVKGLVSAEIFSDFLEMAEYLLLEKYKDSAAVMIGSVLEEHLRQLCEKHDIPLSEDRNGKQIAKKADLLNAELASNNVYNKLDQKNVTAWLDLRNKAAHGKYQEYNQAQVESMLLSVTEFISRHSL